MGIIENIKNMAKKKVIEELTTEIEVTPTIIVSDQTGAEVQRFTNVEEGYVFAAENGYQITITV